MRSMSLIDVAGYLLMGSGALHLAAFAMGGFGYGIWGLAPVGILFVLLGYALQRTEWRWLGYIAFLGVGIGASYAMREFFVASHAPNWWYGLILAIDAAAVAALFVFLWRSPKPAADQPG